MYKHPIIDVTTTLAKTIEAGEDVRIKEIDEYSEIVLIEMDMPDDELKIKDGCKLPTDKKWGDTVSLSTYRDVFE